MTIRISRERDEYLEAQMILMPGLYLQQQRCSTDCLLWQFREFIRRHWPISLVRSFLNKAWNKAMVKVHLSLKIWWLLEGNVNRKRDKKEYQENLTHICYAHTQKPKVTGNKQKPYSIMKWILHWCARDEHIGGCQYWSRTVQFLAGEAGEKWKALQYMPRINTLFL